MPLYEYECKKHGRFDRLEPARPWGVDSSYHVAHCPECGKWGDGVISTFNFKFSNPFPVRGNIAGDGEGFTSKYMRREEIAELK